MLCAPANWDTTNLAQTRAPSEQEIARTLATKDFARYRFTA